MNKQEHKAETQASLIQRIEDLANILQGSSVREIELTEGDTEIIIKRQQEELESVFVSQQRPQVRQEIAKPSRNATSEADRSIVITAPLTGIFYSSPSPTSSPFVQIGDIVQQKQVVALIEAMKVFNEVQADVSGRLVQINVKGGTLVKKGDTLFHIEPL